MTVTKESFRDWKADPVTKAVFNGFRDNILKLQELLGEVAGTDPMLDRWRAGVIAGYKDVLLIEFEDTKDDN